MDDLSNAPRARLLFEPNEMQYNLGSSHPMQTQRLQALMELLEACDLWHADHEQTSLRGRPATLDELRLIHTRDYITAVQRLGGDESQMAGQAEGIVPTRGNGGPESGQTQGVVPTYGFDEGDTPSFAGMHDAAAAIAGGTLVALSAVMGLPEGGQFTGELERPLHVFHPAGGLHHAQADRASGFCVYNDIAVAIAHLLQAREAKVAYIDFDAHHGDGVQHAFYDDPRVLTISLHETGRYLFPGTGDVLELGSGSGRGYSVNVPLEAFTEDDSYLDVMDMVLAPLLASFAPDVLVTMHGCDTHAWDPLTHLHLSMRGIQAQTRLAHELAHTYCSGRWVAVGGGGYDPFRVVPRAWSMLWSEMAERSLPKDLPQAWIERWQPVWQAMSEWEESQQEIMGKERSPEHFPTAFLDRPEDVPAQPRRDSIYRQNRETARLVRHLLIPSIVRHAFPAARSHSPFAGLFDLLHASGSGTPSRSKTLETKRGTVLLRDFCPPSLVERLRVERELHAFARRPEGEHQLLLSIAKSPDSELTLAHTPTGEIIGQVTIAPLDAWWEGLENAYEVAIEVSSNWRGLGLARHLLAFALELDALEDMLLFGIGLSWHWDMEGLGITPYRYRQMLIHLFASQGFTPYDTTEPNVMMELANVLLVRIGKRVAARDRERFLQYVRRTPLGRL
jgi:acetoin utilization deacetylase AcuC-like enzyme/GNAT superfamily N-acetyltransferase